jgi:uncharacterized protein (TIGR04551 family)
VKRPLLAALLLAAVTASAPARAQLGDAPDEAPPTSLQVTPKPWKALRLTLDGYLRVRADVFHQLDLDRGPTPSTGLPIWPLGAAGGDDHTLTAIDMRLRLDPTLEIGQAVRVHLRADILDNVGWGSTPDVLPSTTAFSGAALGTAPPTSGVNSVQDAIRVKQVWGEVTLPFGTLAAGRMGPVFNWGTGFFVNNGDCLSCDRGDTGDRIALTLPLVGHFWTVLYEMSASGPYVDNFGQQIPIERRAQVNTVAFAVARWASPEAQLRRLRAGRALIQYGLFVSYRRQDLDAPAWVQPGGLTRGYGPRDFVVRGLESVAGDLWFMIHKGGLRAELEAAMVIGDIQNASTVAGISFRQPITSRQWGGVASLSYQWRRFPIRLRAEVGYASGDDAPGFGARFVAGQTQTIPGDLDGPQLRPPVDTSINNFRFSPDYQVDLVLWRRILGQVTDAVYVKPSVRLGPFGSGMHHALVDISLVDSNAMYVSSTPGNDRHLGVELDLRARYRLEQGFEALLQYGVLFPGAGLRNNVLDKDPRPAQVLELILAYRI